MSSELDDAERYKVVDLPFYREWVAPVLPPRILDFHTHAWTREQWKEQPWRTGTTGGKYMVVEQDYTPEQLLADERRLFPDRDVNVVLFGHATPAVDIKQTNACVADAGLRHSNVFPLIVAGKGLMPIEQLKASLLDGGFFGYKVLLCWIGDNYGSVQVDDMLGPDEMALAEEMRLVVLLHLPSAGRLADKNIQAGVRRWACEYPHANIVLAHCGRCYHPDDMSASVSSIADLKNVYLDTSMVMDPLTLQIVFDHMPSSRVLFGTDLPIAIMRGRRVYVMDHWVDIVLKGYPESRFRVASDDIHATFMAWEIVVAIRHAAENVGLGNEQTRAIFRDNGMRILEQVMNGRALEMKGNSGKGQGGGA
ncbi:MAG: amidohydrolase family protein [Lentisphaerota bacterium]